MSSGKQHSSNVIGIAFGIPTGYALGYFLYPYQIPSLVGGVLFGLLFTPDHDVDEGNITYHYMRKMMGTDFIWKWWWYPYAKGIKHRSWVSHLPIISTIYRYIYSLFPLTILIMKDDRNISRASLFIPAVVSQILSLPLLVIVFILYYYDLLYLVYPFILGNALSDTFHFIADKLS